MKMTTYRGSLPRFPWLILSFDDKDPNNIATQIYSLPRDLHLRTITIPLGMKSIYVQAQTLRGFQAMIITGRGKGLAMWRPGDSDWTPVETRQLVTSGFGDLTYCRGEGSREEVEDCVKVPWVANVKALLGVRGIGIPFLAVVGDMLIVIARRMEYFKVDGSFYPLFADSFVLVEVDVTNGKAREVMDLGNKSIFLSGFDELFAREGMGIYDLAHGTYEHHYKGESFSNIPLLLIEPQI
ncbi:hypothetical protein Droror1_Dr00022547 [Drosera rotundifolia]